jgi:Ca-activated chloride channel family protein
MNSNQNTTKRGETVMKNICLALGILISFAWFITASQPLHAQGVLVNVNPDEVMILPRPPIIIYPNPRPMPRPMPQPVSTYKIKELEVNARLDGQVAKVQVSQSFVNTGSRQMEVCFVFPLPYDGAVDQLTLLIDGKEFPAKLIEAKEARKTYEEIVRKNQDPALLEWMGSGMFKTSVFPVPPGAERKVTLRYSELCRQWDGLTDFIFPMSTAKYTLQPIEEVKFNATIESDSDIKNVYSPSHAVDIKRPDDKHAIVSFTAKNAIPTDDFRLFFDVGKGIVGTKLLSYRPNTSDDGYFMLLTSPQIKAEDVHPKKTVILALDRSGSMSGDKIDQAKNAAKFVVNHLREGDLFNMIAYDSEVESWKPELQKFNDDTRKAALGFTEGIYAGGSTNINGALSKALGQLTDGSRPNFVIFLTDGIPTVGETNETKIVAAAKMNNKVHARIFDFGVGYDVNSRLLDKLARENFGLTEYVRPNENIERSVAALYNRIGSPVMSDVKLTVDLEGIKPEEGSATNRVYPKDVVDLFAGEQLVLVGRYKKSGAAKVTITGKVGTGAEKEIHVGPDSVEQKFDFPAKFVEHSDDESQAFIEKLWAVRRVGEILDEIDLKGHNDELVKELVSLSLAHGIMTPYTSFLADEHAQHGDLTSSTRSAGERLRAFDKNADGVSGVEQRIAKHEYQQANQPAAASPMQMGGGGRGSNGGGMGGGAGFQYGGVVGNATSGPTDSAAIAGTRATTINGGTLGDHSGQLNQYYGAVSDAKDDAGKVAQNVRQIGRKSFYRRGDRWVDSAVTAELEKKTTKIKRFSSEYFELIDKYGKDTAKYLATDEPQTIELGGQAYEISD